VASLKKGTKTTENSTKHIVEVKGLTKIFDNEVRAIDGISFNVEEGEILGFIGPNGAGKRRRDINE